MVAVRKGAEAILDGPCSSSGLGVIPTFAAAEIPFIPLYQFQAPRANIVRYMGWPRFCNFEVPSDTQYSASQLFLSRCSWVVMIYVALDVVIIRCYDLMIDVSTNDFLSREVHHATPMSLTSLCVFLFTFCGVLV